MRNLRKVKGVVIIAGKVTMETVGFRNLKEFVRILKAFHITGNDEIVVHIQRGDGADR